MWIIIRTAKGKNSVLTEAGEWSPDEDVAERFDQYEFAVSQLDRIVPERHRRGVGIVKQAVSAPASKGPRGVYRPDNNNRRPSLPNPQLRRRNVLRGL